MACLSAALFTACSSGDGVGSSAGSGTGGGGSGGSSPVTSSPTLLLTSLDGGASLLGEVTELPLDASAAAAAFMKFEGTPWIQYPDFNGHGLVFNSTDNKFYGVFNGTGADRLGVLASFDPATDKLTLLKSFVRRNWPAVAGVKGESLAFEQPSDFSRRPLLSPDGKSLLLRSIYGGVNDRGALIHVNIDPASASYLKETLVYSFFDYEKAKGNYCDSLRAIGSSGITEMAWGKDTGGAAVLYMAVGGENIDLGQITNNPTVPGNCHPYTTPQGAHMDKIYGRMFALKPGEAGDLSKPWAYALGYTPFDPLLHLGRQIYWDTKKLAIRWTTEVVGGELSFFAGNATGSTLYFSAIEQCYRLQGLLPLNLNGDALALCSGLNGSDTLPDSPPRIFRYTGNDLFTQQANLGGWYADRKMFHGATSSLVSRRLFVNGGDIADSCAGGDEACVGGPGTVEELDPATGYVQRVLATGDSASIGYNFLGDPAVGGSAREPMADRYVVWFGAVVKGYSNVLNKYDRATGQTSTLPLDPKNGAHPDGRLLDLGNGQALGLLRFAAPKALTTSTEYLKGTGGYAGGTGSSGSSAGHYLVDLKTRQILNSVSQDASIREFSKERVRLDDGTVWEALVYEYDARFWRTFNKVDPGTGKLTPTDTEKREEFNYPRDPFALAGRASAALYLPFWKANVDAAKGHADVTLGCMRPDTAKTLFESNAFGPAQAGFGNAHRIVYGATYSVANKAMYLATSKVADADQGTIFEVDKGLADADLCKAKPVVTALVTGLADVPSTKIVAMKSGALVYGTANGRLMKLDVAGRRAVLVADLKGAAASSQVKGYLSEAGDSLVAAVVYDYDAAGNNTARRLVTVDVDTARQTPRDVSKLIGNAETYPGVMRLN